MRKIEKKKENMSIVKEYKFLKIYDEKK